jgi:RNA polymerase sigma factor (sigma-70 family)
MINDDMALVREYARRNSEQAFATLVSRHVNLVYSVALRQVHDVHLAEEITQGAFIILARKAKSFSPKTIVSGWLCRTARYVATNALSIQRRRQFREQEAYMQSTLNETDADVWNEVSPMLDEALNCLAEKEHNAVVLRFFEGKDLKRVGAEMGMSEDAARMRVNRGVEKLRRFFTKRGVTLSAAMIAGVVSTYSVQAAPPALAKSVTTLAIVKGAAASGSVLTLVEGALKIMTWSKAKTAVVVGVAVLLAGGVATVALSGNPSEGPPPVIPTGEHNGVTFFSLLEKTPIVANAVFEKELFIAGIPSNARKQTFSFKRDGDNYLLAVQDGAGIQVGRFDGVMWHTQAGQLIEYDPKINKNGGNDGGVIGLESVTTKTMDLFLTLGVTEIKPGSAIWDENRQRFAGMTEDGRKLTVDVMLENGVPGMATVLRGDGVALATIKYKYAPSFYHGLVPVEFTRYWNNFTNANKKVFTVRLRSLEISDGHLNTALIDPAQCRTSYSKYFYSNDIAYWITSRGKVSRVLTMDEYKQQMESLKTRAAQPRN